jgi:hypothetical protein
MPAKEATMIELTEEQARALEVQASPLHVRNPRTGEVYVLVRQDVYNLTCSIIGGPNRRGWENPADDDLIQKNP